MSWDVILTRCSNVDLPVQGGVVVDLDVGVGPDAEQLSQSLSTSASIMSCPTLLRCSTSTSTTSSRPLRSSACRPRSLLTSLFPVGQTTSEEFCAASSKCSDNSHAGSEYIDSPTADLTMFIILLLILKTLIILMLILDMLIFLKPTLRLLTMTIPLLRIAIELISQHIADRLSGPETERESSYSPPPNESRRR